MSPEPSSPKRYVSIEYPTLASPSGVRKWFSSSQATSFAQMNSVPGWIRNFTSFWNRSNESAQQCSKPRFSGVPTGSSMRTSPGATRFQFATHAALSPAFHVST